jgi:hypothetical protein
MDGLGAQCAQSPRSIESGRGLRRTTVERLRESSKTARTARTEIKSLIGLRNPCYAKKTRTS